MLTELQRRIGGIIADLDEFDGFALAGGAALIVREIVDRTTRDLDYFATSQADVARLAPAVERALGEAGLQVRRDRSSPGFVRLEVSDGQDTCEVDLAVDARLRPAESSPLGAVLASDELAADKMLALFGRARGRDFVDVDALLDRYERHELLELAASKDAGFSPLRFAEALGALDRLPRGDFPIDDRGLDRLRARMAAWERELRKPETSRDIDPPRRSR